MTDHATTDDVADLIPTEDGATELRFVRRLPHPPERVWRALTAPDEVAAWFPDTVVGTIEAGATLAFRFDGDTEDQPGRVVTFAPPTLLELDWCGDRLRLSLAAVEVDGRPGTELTFTDTFAERGKAARDGAGWHVCLADLAAVLDPPAAASGEAGDRWEAIHRLYLDAFPADASTTGVPGS